MHSQDFLRNKRYNRIRGILPPHFPLSIYNFPLRQKGAAVSTSPLLGLPLAQAFYQAVGEPALRRQFPDVLARAAIGLAGEGSECFGFDDALSRDHDWGAGFCIWLSPADFAQHGDALQRCYQSLTVPEGLPCRPPTATHRVGCLSATAWMAHYTGCAHGPQTVAQWQCIPSAFLATATNGAIFHPGDGDFVAVRDRLLRGFPPDILHKRLAYHVAIMAQAGQYNHPRCLARGDMVAAQLALQSFTVSAMQVGYLLNGKYAPFYKWMHRGMDDFTVLPRLQAQIAQLYAPNAAVQQGIEGICLVLAATLRRLGFSHSADDFLQAHACEIFAKIEDAALRNTHMMEELSC